MLSAGKLKTDRVGYQLRENRVETTERGQLTDLDLIKIWENSFFAYTGQGVEVYFPRGLVLSFWHQSR